MSMTFSMRGTSASDITDVRLQYTVSKMNYANVISEARPIFTTGRTVQAKWSWDMRKSALPAAAKLQYWWVVKTSAGDLTVSEKHSASFNDTRYTWRTVTSAPVTVAWYDGSNSFGQALLTGAQEGLTRLKQDTGATLDKPVTVWNYAGSRDLQGAMIFAKEWTGGAAYPDYGIIVLGVSTSNLDWGRKAIAHELGHLVVNQLTFSPWSSSLPVWLNEGLAMYAEGQSASYDADTLNIAIKSGNLISLRSLSAPFSAIPAVAILSYAESYSVVNYLIKTYGKDKMLAMLTAFRQGSTADDALSRVYELNQDSLFSRWKQSVAAGGVR
jgi:hypothetical protein